MNKLVLKDGTELTVVNPFENSFQMETTTEEMASVFDTLNESNLSEFTLQNEEGEVMAIFKNKKPISCMYADGIATFNLGDVDLTEQRISALEDTIDTLLLEDMGVDE